MTHPTDSLMAIFGYKRSATISGNVIEPVFEIDCGACGERHRSDDVPFQCENGDDI